MPKMSACSDSKEADLAHKTTLTLYSPRPWQVFQRQSMRTGKVLIDGRLADRADVVEVKFTGRSAGGALDGRWRRAKLDRASRAFRLSAQLPAGGWYSLEVRARVGGETVASARAEKFGVGEVFVTAGQSNSTSCGQFPTKQRSGMVSAFNGTQWKTATDPMWGAYDLIGVSPTELIVYAGGSPWLSFGDAMYKRYGVPIGVAVTGQGGSSVLQWQPGEDVFAWMMTRIWQLGAGGFRAVLWHQGESDCEMPPGQYCEKLARVIEASRAEGGWAIPWSVAKVSYRGPDLPRLDSMRVEFDAIWESGIALAGPDTDTLGGDNRDDDGKGVHFSPKGLRAHGRMWANVIAKWLGKP
ncbi:hypothetical protein LCGC14_0124760 [marine sediment metagenome]|uniref:Sialate O-acetylesterase domain-containing protein n=1 Tax=marine sediment metagenome TaxID=412755 RepID=A0A0F9XMT5_9ZZZZ|nr:hypothetical protein [Phycisphaerae bacterium]HDZ43651.1 hypothetical protein [Phycisphaerae bacterium]